MKIILEKIILVLLLILFFSLPLVNSHLLNLFGIDSGYYVDGNYEFTKVIFFNVFSGIIFLFFGLQKIIYQKTEKNIFNKSIVKYFLIFLAILLLSTYFSISPYLSLFGSTSKGHGSLMFINLFLLLIVLINQKNKYLKIIIKTMIIGIFITAILAIKEYFIPSLNYGDLGNRALGTMGHPNYLSLILLMIIALLYNNINKYNKTRVNILNNKNYNKLNKIDNNINKYNETGLKILDDKNYNILNKLNIIQYLYYLILFTLIITLFLTKSLFGIILFIFYTYYFIIYKSQYKFNKKIYNSIFILLIIIFTFICFYFYIEKLSSFLSRFYIWKTTLNISFDNIKILIFGGGFDTLDLIFNKYKDIHLYIFENIGFTADRPHNFIINIFYHLGLLGVSFLFYSLYLLTKYYKKLKKIGYKKIGYKKLYLFEIILLFFIFNLFNYPGIVSYAILILFIAYIFETGLKLRPVSKICIPKIVFLIIIILYSVFSIYNFSKYYISEIKAYNNNYIKAIQIFKYNADNYYRIGEINTGLKTGKYKSEYYYISKSYFDDNYITGCKNLIIDFPTPENYFLCGKLFYELGNKKLGVQYYKKGLELLPDLWNKNSKYYKIPIIKDIISPHRFFSKKYSDIKEILKIVNNN